MKRNGTEGSDKEVSGRSIDFLGYRFTKDKTLLRKSIKERFARKLKNVKNEKRRHEIKASYWGWCKHGDCRHLWNIITDNDMSFLEKGIKRSDKTKDGKKFFEVEEKRMMEILNISITVVDCELGLHTKMGDDRCCILFSEKGSEKLCKVITNSFKIKDVLKSAKEAEKAGKEIFPVEDVVIRRRALRDGKSDYYFEE
ncbi:hypothetical protein [Massilibacteroides sp.]|uniref:hypothetical protein n=1 Tax=Massilibacteroides sp. TaxID=2034766 RepID=UPI002608BED3|nr:hypothetical protein [Massilibacteroides sp.]MDD4515111.1 hypothetical protein [Massilibacteroides sp.]